MGAISALQILWWQKATVAYTRRFFPQALQAAAELKDLSRGLLQSLGLWFLTSVLAFLAQRPHRPFFDSGKNRNRLTVKFQNFGNRNGRFCRLGAKSQSGTSYFR
jgi:hypothetical protein